MELLALAQIHRESADRAQQGPRVAAWYAEHADAELWGCEARAQLIALAGVEPGHVDGVMLHDLAVLTDMQRGGVGSALIAFLCERFPSRTIFGHTLDAAVGFYQHLGFHTEQIAEYGLVEAEAQAFYRFRLVTPPFS